MKTGQLKKNKKGGLPIILSLMILSGAIIGCRPSVQDHTLHYGVGAGWYHEGKSSEEMIKDFDECRALARENDNDPFVENDCMKSKGYTLK